MPHFSTKAIHIGSEPENSLSSGVTPAIDLSTTYLQSAVGVHKGYEYSRSGNPTRLALERNLAAIENAEFAYTFASGSAATAAVINTIAGYQGHVISIADVYGGTHRYLTQVAKVQLGVDVTLLDLSYGAAIEGLVDGAIAGGVGDDKVEDGATNGSGSANDHATINGNVLVNGKGLANGNGAVNGYSSANGTNGTTENATTDPATAALLERLAAAIIPGRTKLIWIESPTNPLLSVAPIAAIASLALQHGLHLVVDNTFASPFYQSPLVLGASVVVHSLTKYVNGHSDAVMGAVLTSDAELSAKLKFFQNAGGAVPAPFDCFMVLRGIKTLAVRMQQHGINSLKLAQFLLTVPASPRFSIRHVAYPGLTRPNETARQKREREQAWDNLNADARAWAIAQGYTRDTGFPFSGMVTFAIAAETPALELEYASTFLKNLRVFHLAESLGGVESLAELPAEMTHGGISVEEKIAKGIRPGLVRLSVGIEDYRDIEADVVNALKQI